MKKELAQHLAYVLRHCSGLLDHTVWLMKCHGTEAEFLQHRKAVGHVLAELGIQLLYPIWREYPDLEPALPPSSEDHEGQSSEKLTQGENHPDLSDPGDRNS